MEKKLLNHLQKEIHSPVANYQRLQEESKSSAEAFDELMESNFHVEALEFLNKFGVISPNMIRPLVKILVRQTKSQVCLFDDPDSDNWKNLTFIGVKLQQKTLVVFLLTLKFLQVKLDILKNLLSISSLQQF